MTHDPDEGIGPDGIITTGVRADRIPERYRDLVSRAVADLASVEGIFSLYLYGSVATGKATAPTSDLDLLVVMKDHKPEPEVRERATHLSQRHRDLVREIGITPVPMPDILAKTVDGLGLRCFIKHYCVHLYGSPIHQRMEPCLATSEVAWAFNHDIADAVASAKTKLSEATTPDQVADVCRALTRKVTLAATSLVSMAKNIWTTDRAIATRSIAELYPEWAPAAETALRWCVSPSSNPDEVSDFINGYGSWVAYELKRLHSAAS